MTKLYFVSE